VKLYYTTTHTQVKIQWTKPTSRSIIVLICINRSGGSTYALIDKEDQHEEGSIRNVENMNIDSYCILNELQAVAYEDDDDCHHHLHFANN